jgi:hypothetical protein
MVVFAIEMKIIFLFFFLDFQHAFDDAGFQQLLGGILARCEKSFAV